LPSARVCPSAAVPGNGGWGGNASVRAWRVRAAFWATCGAKGRCQWGTGTVVVGSPMYILETGRVVSYVWGARGNVGVRGGTWGMR